MEKAKQTSRPYRWIAPKPAPIRKRQVSELPGMSGNETDGAATTHDSASNNDAQPPAKRAKSTGSNLDDVQKLAPPELLRPSKTNDRSHRSGNMFLADRMMRLSAAGRRELADTLDAIERKYADCRDDGDVVNIGVSLSASLPKEPNVRNYPSPSFSTVGQQTVFLPYTESVMHRLCDRYTPDEAGPSGKGPIIDILVMSRDSGPGCGT